MRIQSVCPKTNFKEYYTCTGKNLGDAAKALKQSSKDFLFMLGAAGVAAYLAPASFGLSAFGTVLGGGTAAYLFMTETYPAFLKFKNALFPYLEARWIFSKALFEVVVADFNSEVSTNLNLAPKFRTLTSADGAVGTGVNFFINSMKTLEEYWNKLTAVFGKYPLYKNNETATTLATADITISSVSNSNVKYVGHTNQSVTFKSTSGKNEAFKYKVTVTKEGFTEEKTLSAQVTVNCPTIPFATNRSVDGSIAIQNVQGGVAPYLYSLANSPFQSNIVFVGPYVSGNSYLVKVKDANNCETTETRIISKEPCGNLATITDGRDEKVYKTVQIGSQVWMAENLNYVTGNNWCYDDNPSNCNIYGRLYDWQTANNACPSGWHLPSDAEWINLTDFLGGAIIAGGKLKTMGTQYWESPNTDATNSSCFSGIPGGTRLFNGSFGNLGKRSEWWSSTEFGSNAWARYLGYNFGDIGAANYGDKADGRSVRCVKN